MRICRNCGPLPLAEFYPSSRTRLCKACQNRARTERARANPDQQRAVRRRIKLKKYGLTPEDYDRMVAEQGGLCAICLREGEIDPTSQLRLGVDHNHTTGRVRGLLCRPCNQALGVMGDDPERCDRMAEYLRADLRTQHQL